MHAALLLIDIQNDFLPGGSLAVADGDRVIPVANRLIPQFERVIASQDWHPQNHGSFAANHAGAEVGQVITLDGLDQILWPVHCVQETSGAEFSNALMLPDSAKVIRKGTNPLIDSYSAFFDNGHRQSTGLQEYLESQQVDRLYLAGLATDYCVKYTALDARQLGMETIFVVDGCRGVDIKPGDVRCAIQEMQNAGVQVLSSAGVRP